MTDYSLSSQITPRVIRSTRSYRDYTSFDEAEESDYDKRHNNAPITNGPVNNRWRANSIASSTYTPSSYVRGR
ncbi:38289_t:CDS:1, partial [Gigaspora margarita]